MYRFQKNYLKWAIRLYGLLKWTFPKKLVVYIKQNPQYTDESSRFINIGICFKIKERKFRVALFSSIKFEDLNEIPEAFLRAHKKAFRKIEREGK